MTTVRDFRPEGDGLFYRLEADDGGNLLITVIEEGFDQPQSFRVHSETAKAALNTLSTFLDQATETDEKIEAAPLDAIVSTVQGEARVVRSVYHELTLELKVAAGLSINFKLGLADAQQLHEILTRLVPIRHIRSAS